MAAALITVTSLSVAGLLAAVAGGFLAGTSAEIVTHVGFSIFVTIMVLLSHSMTMFYLIGKGRAIREAVAEGGLSMEFVSAFGALRRPVFSSATLAMALTMATAILGGGVDTGVLPPAIHSALAVASAASNLHSLRVELRALTSSDRITRDVNRLLGV